MSQARQLVPECEPVEGLERLRECLLYQILRLGTIAFEPHRVSEQLVEVRHRLGFKGEPATVGVTVSSHRASTPRFPSSWTTASSAAILSTGPAAGLSVALDGTVRGHRSTE